MRVHLINPSSVSFGTAVITPRWQYVLAAATPRSYGDPVLVDETLEPVDPDTIQKGDAVGIGIHTANALRGYEIGKIARERGAYVIFGGIHATLFPEEAHELGGAHSVVKGDGDSLEGGAGGLLQGRIHSRLRRAVRSKPSDFLARALGLDPAQPLHVGVGADRARMSEALLVLFGVEDRWPAPAAAYGRCRNRRDRAIAAARIPIHCAGGRQFLSGDAHGLDLASQQKNEARLSELNALRAERFELMARLAQLPDDMVFFTQITMEAAEDTSFLDAMKAARIKGALVGVEAVTPAGLKDVYKDFNLAGDDLIERLKTFRKHGVHVLGSFIFGLPSDRPETFDATAAAREQRGAHLRAVRDLSPYPGTVDFARWEKQLGDNPPKIAGRPLTRRWLIPQALRPKLYWDHPVMSAEEIRSRTQGVWDAFYSWGPIWRRSSFIKSSKGRLAFVLISSIYRQMYADTGIATDSARVTWSGRWTRMMAKPCRRLFAGKPMPDLKTPERIGDFVRLTGWTDASKMSTKDLGVC